MKEHRGLQEIIFSKQDYFDHVVNLTRSSVYWKDLTGIYLGCNRSMLNMLGISCFREIVGKTDFDLPWSSSASELQKNDRSVIKSGKLHYFEETGELSNGDIITVISNKMPLINPSGKTIGIVGASLDVTRLKKIEVDLKLAKKAVEATNHAKTEFLENMRHDIRTPLSGIIGCAQLLQEEKNAVKIAEYVQDLVQSSNALLEFLNKVLEAIQVATGEIPRLKK
jgi:two-component system, OmpR family, aerobic respiration control sensor histidine kinase ArcB